MLKRYDLTGRTFGSLLVKKFHKYIFIKSRNKNLSTWECDCKCGNLIYVKRYNLIKGTTRHCGCEYTKKYEIEETYFEKINTQDKAYFFGFILTDGNIDYRKSNKRITIKIGLKDESILKTFKKYLNTNKPLEYHKRRFKMYGDYKVKSGQTVAINISNIKMVEDIIKLGLKPAKTKTVTYPSSKVIPHNLMHHFIRGVFDGDGTSGRGHIQFASGSHKFLKGFKKYLKKYQINSYIVSYNRIVKATSSRSIYWVLCINASFSGSDKSGIRRKKKSGRFYAIPKSKQKLNQKLFFKTIYKNCHKDLFLKRKKEKLYSNIFR